MTVIEKASSLDYSLCFLNCHLTPHEGMNAFMDRNQEMDFILNNLLLKRVYKSTKNLDPTQNSFGFRTCLEYPKVFILGDLNYRTKLAWY